MTPLQFREARAQLGLTIAEMARMLGLSEIHIYRLQVPPEASTYRAISETTERLLQAYLEGYRPADWPGAKRRRARRTP